MAQIASFPGAREPRERTLARVRDALGDEQTDMLLDRGAAMTYDEVIGYALEELG